MFRSLSVAAILISVGILLTQFQNCAPEGAFEAASIDLSAAEGVGGFEGLEGDDHDFLELQTKATSQFVPPMMDRQMIASLFENAFGPSWAAVDTSNVEARATEFSKDCSIYSEYLTSVSGKKVLGQDAEVCRLTSANFIVSLESVITPSRSSYLLRTCSDLSNHNTTLTYFMNKVGKTADRNAYSDDTLINAYSLFYVGKPEPSQTVIDSLRFIGVSQKDVKKAWSAIAFTLCASGHWQVL